MNSKTIVSFLAAMCLLAYGCGDTGVSGAELETRPGGSAGDGGNGGNGGDAGSAGDGGTETIPCDFDDDCPRGEECEFEHGMSFCKPHGGDDDDDDRDHDDDDNDHDDDDDDDDCDHYDCDDDYEDRSGSNSGKG